MFLHLRINNSLIVGIYLDIYRIRRYETATHKNKDYVMGIGLYQAAGGFIMLSPN